MNLPRRSLHGIIEMVINLQYSRFQYLIQPIYYNYNIFTCLQEMSLVEEYLQCYRQLVNPKLTKEANKRLMQIQASFDAWAVAEALVSDHKYLENQIHGCQLLSQKLSCPLPQEIQPTTIANFLYSQPNKTKTHWLCISKALLHMNSTQPLQLEYLSTDQQRLYLLKEISSAITSTHTRETIDSKKLLNKYLDSNKQLLLKIFDSNVDLVAEVIQGFLEGGVKLNSVQIIRKLLEHDLQEVGGLLQRIFSHQIYPTLTQQILSYLEMPQNKQRSFSVHLQFYKNNYKSLTDEQFGNMISSVLKAVQIGDEEDFLETYYFWNDILNEHSKKSLSEGQSRAFQNGIVALWRLICIRCVLNQLPIYKMGGVSNLSLSLDDDEPEDLELHQNIQTNYNAEHFRNQAGDFLNICIQAFGQNSHFVEQINLSLEALASNTLLELELAIYLLSTICEVIPKASKKSKATVLLILKRQQELNEYLCRKIIDLIAKLANLFATSPDILAPCLSFLAKCLKFQSLAPLASQSCCQLLEEVGVEESFLLSEDLQQFLRYLYQVFFSEPLGDKTRDNLAKAMVVFIQKFKNTASHYLEYLQDYSARIQSMNSLKKAKFLQSAIAAQFWINVHEEQKHRPAFQQFLKINSNFLLENILAVQNKGQLSATINLLNLALKTNAISSYIDTWIYVVNQIQKKFVNPEIPTSIVITPLINLGKASLELKNQEITEKITQLLSLWASQTIVLLGDITSPKIQFNISSAVVQLHFILLKIYSQRQDLIPKGNYSPNNMLTFICSCFNKAEIWQYELYKYCLGYLTLAVKLGTPPKQIITVLFRNYRKFADTLWTSVQPLLFQAYKSSGSEPILSSLESIKSVFDSKNPLTDILIESLKNGEGKTIKNILLSLT